MEGPGGRDTTSSPHLGLIRALRGLVLLWDGLTVGWDLLKAPWGVLKGYFIWGIYLVLTLNGKEGLVSLFLCLPGSSKRMTSSAFANHMALSHMTVGPDHACLF